MRRGLIALIVVAVLGIIIFSTLFSQAGVTGNSVFDRFFDLFDRGSSGSGNQNLNVDPPLRLVGVWKSSPLAGGNIWDATVGDLDNDGKMEIIYPNWQPTKEVVIFENNGDNSYSQVWSYAIPAGGIIKTLDIYDYDNDGLDELIVGNYNNAYYIFKNNGDNNYILLEYVDFYIPSAPEQIVGLELSDTNNNGINEIIMARSGSTSDSRLEIYENGVEIFEDVILHNPSYWLVDLTVGKIDNDNYIDIITGNGGTYSKLNWWEFNPSINSYERRMIDLPFIMLAPVVKIVDIDLDGQNEFIVAGKYTNNNGFVKLIVLVYGSNSNNQLTLLSSSEYFSYGQNPLDIALFDLQGNSNLEIFVSTSGTSGYPVTVALFSYNNQQVIFEEYFQEELGNNDLIDLDSIDVSEIDGDNKVDIILSARCCELEGGERVYVYEFQ